MNEEAAETLRLSMPRRPFLWPALIIALGCLQGLSSLQAFPGLFRGSLGGRIFGLLLVPLFMLSGANTAVCLMACRWRELRREGDRLLLKPWLSGPLGLRVLRLANPGLARLRHGEYLAIPLTSTSLEWVGKTLHLHSACEFGCILGRGAQAETIAQWLVGQGLPKPVGR